MLGLPMITCMGNCCLPGCRWWCLWRCLILCCSFSHEIPWIRDGTELSQVLSISYLRYLSISLNSHETLAVPDQSFYDYSYFAWIVHIILIPFTVNNLILRTKSLFRHFYNFSCFSYTHFACIATVLQP